MISLIFLLGFLYIFCAAALFINARKNWLINRLKRNYPIEGYADNENHPDNENHGLSSGKRKGSLFGKSRGLIFGRRQGSLFGKRQVFSGGKNIDAANGSKSIVKRLDNWLIKSNIRVDAATFIFIILVVLSLVFTVSIFFKNGILIFLSVSVFLFLAAFIFIDHRSRKILQKKEDQLEGFLLDLTGNLYANPNVLASIQKTLELAEDPLKSEFETVIEDTRRGILLNEALFGMIIRNKSEIIRMVISGFIASNEKGVDLIEYLKDQLDYIREKKSISSYIRILSSGPRYTSYVIMLIPVAVIFIVSFLNKSFAQSLLNGIGLWILLYALVSYAAGFLIINRIVNIAEKGR